MVISAVRLSLEGRHELESDLHRLELQLPEAAARISAARESGADPSENLELRDSISDLSLLESRMGELRFVLASAELIEAEPIRDGRANLGADVRVRHSDGEEATYRLVAPAEARPRQGRISVESPIGSAVVGHAAGTQIVAETPEGPEELLLLEVS